MKKLLIILSLFLLSLGGVTAQTYRISANGGCILVKNMAKGSSSCGKLEFEDRVSFILVKPSGGASFSADFSELKDGSGNSLGNNNAEVMVALGKITGIYNSVLTPKSSTNGTDTAIPCLLYTSPSPRDRSVSRMPSSA